MPSDDPTDFDLSTEELRRLGHQAVELIAEIFADERRDPVITPASGEAVRAALDEPLPRRGTPAAELLAPAVATLRAYNRKNGHPRFFAYVAASADPLGVIADALASAMNQIPTSWRSAPAAAELERLVVRWLDEMVGFDGGGQGLLTSGGSAANHNAVACAVARAEGISDDRRRMTLYLSREGHMSIRKAARHLGIPHDHVRVVAIDAARRLVIEDLERRLAEDLEAGLVPACICASAGTANTGAVDPLLAVAEVAARHGVWLHIDGAYGAPAVLTRDYAWMREAFARADSISLDPHKWLFAPFDVGCVLVRDAAASHRAFALDSEYVHVSQTDEIERHAFFDHGLELSRRMRALKVWLILKARGVDALTRVIERNIALRRHLDERVARDDRLEPLGSDLSISCFRYLPGSSAGSGVDPDALNRHILETLVREGRIHMSPTTLEGRYALRVSIVNFRTRESDIDLLVDEVLRVGDQALSP